MAFITFLKGFFKNTEELKLISNLKIVPCHYLLYTYTGETRAAIDSLGITRVRKDLLYI